MRPIPNSLKVHQRGPDRLPHVRAIIRAERWGVPLLPWERLYTDDERDCPHALAVAGDGTVVRARNDAGELTVSRVSSPGADSAWGTWTGLGKAEPETGVALGARGSEVLLLYVASGGRALALRRSGDGGATWEAARTLVTASTAIEWLALGVRASDGDACAFYTQGTNVLKRLRRGEGVWDASGTNWTRGGQVSALTGVGAMHDGRDYRLVVSGRAHPSGRKRVWSAFLGDGGFPADFWSGLSVIAESDASSAREFGGPGVFRPGGLDQRACFAALDVGGEPGSRVYTSHPPASVAGNPEGWSEPEPHEATSAYGLAVATPEPGTAWGSTPDGVWRARLGRSLDVSAHIVDASWRLAPFATRARLVLDDSSGALPELAPGRTVEIAPGYRSGAGGGPEYGGAVHAVIDDVTRERGEGQARVVLECSGHWERLAAWRPSQVWQTAAGEYSRERLFWRLCASAGIRVSGQGGEDWSGSSPAFAVSPGESGLSAARRLLGTSRVAVLSSGDGLAVSQPGPEAVERSGRATTRRHAWRWATALRRRTGCGRRAARSTRTRTTSRASTGTGSACAWCAALTRARGRRRSTTRPHRSSGTGGSSTPARSWRRSTRAWSYSTRSLSRTNGWDCGNGPSAWSNWGWSTAAAQAGGPATTRSWAWGR